MTWSNRGAVSMPKHVSKLVEMRDHRGHYILTMSSHAISRGLLYTHTRRCKKKATTLECMSNEETKGSTAHTGR